MFEKLIAKKTESFERKLGAKLSSLLAEVESRVNVIGKEIGGKKGTSITKKILRKTIYEIVHDYWKKNLNESSLSSNDYSTADRTAESCLLELFEIDGIRFDSSDLKGGSELGNESSSEVRL